MVTEIFGTPYCVYWNSTTKIITELASSRPNICYELLLIDGKQGLRSVPASSQLKTLLDRVSWLSRWHCADMANWSAALNDLRQATTAEALLKPGKHEHPWSERSALAALTALTEAAMAGLENQEQKWDTHISNAYLHCSTWLAEVAYTQENWDEDGDTAYQAYESRLQEARAYHLRKLEAYVATNKMAQELAAKRSLSPLTRTQGLYVRLAENIKRRFS